MQSVTVRGTFPAFAPSPHGPNAAASQSTFLAPSTLHAPRSAPVVSNAKRIASWPESWIVKMIDGCATLTAAAELSVRSRRARIRMVRTWSGATPKLSGDAGDAAAARGSESAGEQPSSNAATTLATRRRHLARRVSPDNLDPLVVP